MGLVSIILRELKLPDDYEPLARLLNSWLSEPTTAGQLEQEDAQMYTAGHTYKNEEGRLTGYDRTRRVAVDEQNRIVGFVTSWRAPWTEPGALNNTLIVAAEYRGQGIGTALYEHAVQWGSSLGADTLYAEVWDDSLDSIRFAERRGFRKERHMFQSELRLDGFDPNDQEHTYALERLNDEGIRLITLADESGEASERKLYELYRETLPDIPGHDEEVPPFDEWRKWYLAVEGYAEDRVLIAVDGDRYVGVTNVLYNEQTNGMYNEYTGVSGDYRGRGIASGLKIMAARLAHQCGADYIRTDNDSLNGPMLHINRRLGYEPLRGKYRLIAHFGSGEN
ncbi:GNAT family N-acetyltransferase [Paenibacillus xylaniclasticus]|uniref:GNAT family N-acetyltransferase n=1 Tax=Paenibacillus xylaniclasticus TaxID=588083 RepID=UPI000FDC5EB5|nr:MULTISPECIES: GNAT family N-acetyltransferase [Paenibacillus]GFN30824.1 N-acetyltransferase [Paenibacillus curdlanolyticus]